MASSTAPANISPPRTDVLQDTYAIYVDEGHVHVWQYRVTISEPDGAWYFVETLDREDEPRLSLEYAKPMAPTAEGYWIYSHSYDCTMDCA